MVEGDVHRILNWLDSESKRIDGLSVDASPLVERALLDESQMYAHIASRIRRNDHMPHPFKPPRLSSRRPIT